MRESLYRGENVGVFTGPNGYYVAGMASDGVSHYQPANGGGGWSDELRRECNAEAKALDSQQPED